MAEIKFRTHEEIVRQLLSDSYWQVQVKTFDVSDQLVYLACNTDHGADVAAETWYIWKYTWTGSNNTMIEGPLLGSVDGQDSLAWRA